MFVAVDDTDSVKGNCTTFLATEIIRVMVGIGADLIGNPRLVRLNPAVPWKTRGNGSLVMMFGKGVGEKRFIGMIENTELYCFDEFEELSTDQSTIIELLKPLVERFHSEDADPGLLVTRIRPPRIFYERGVTTIMDRSEIDKGIEDINGLTFTIGNGRGLIGAFCGLAWIPDDHTFELLAYRMPERWGTLRLVDAATIREMNMTCLTTFNSWEEREQKVAMVPATPCPVLFGLRGDDEDDLKRGAEIIKSEERYRWVIFLTNQGTDDHIIHDATELIPNQSYLISGKVVENKGRIHGGHAFIDIETRYGIVTCAAYEPSKEFRLVFDHLIPGDEIEVMGEFREEPKTLNTEKIHVISLADLSKKLSNPLCPVCARRMDSIGRDQGYRCRKCHTKSNDPVSESVTRFILPGWYEPPTAARRHLSKPLKRMGLEQPVEFVNSRTQ